MKTKHYSKEFRLQAARLVVEQGYSYVEVAQRLGPSAWSVRDWVSKYRKSGELPPEGSPDSTGDEMNQLRKENSRLRMENDILKKAAAYFAREVMP
jgi:transposase-like protein